MKSISDIRVGDRVLAADAAGRTSYSDVVFVPHRANNDDALFTHISTASGRDIKMTQSHIILAGPCGSAGPLPLSYASSVSVGDCVMTVSGEETVSTVETVQGKGLYIIVTKEEYVVVNGIIASPFAANHMLANLYYNVHRFVYASAPSLLNYPSLHFANEVRYHNCNCTLSRFRRIVATFTLLQQKMKTKTKMTMELPNLIFCGM